MFSEDEQAQSRKWMETPNDGVFIHGKAGVGKTTLACALLMEMHRGGWKAFFEASAQMYRSLRSSYGQGHASESQILDFYARIGVLCIDDIGAGGLTDFERRMLLEVLEVRLNSLRPTIITSNWRLSEISEKIDERVASRLAGLFLLEITGRDRRMAAKPKSNSRVFAGGEASNGK